MTDEWFAVVTGATLEQGDLIRECPIFRVERRSQADADSEVIEESHDVIVLTQTCDLEHDKVQEVLVAAVLSYDDLVQREGKDKPQLKSRGFRGAAVAGNLASYSLLPDHSTAPMLSWSLVDFHHLFSVPKSLARQVADEAGDRLRLVPPYKEHLAQAFARYIMRVGLPSTLHAFEGYTPS